MRITTVLMPLPEVAATVSHKRRVRGVLVASQLQSGPGTNRFDSAIGLIPQREMKQGDADEEVDKNRDHVALPYIEGNPKNRASQVGGQNAVGQIPEKGVAQSATQEEKLPQNLEGDGQVEKKTNPTHLGSDLKIPALGVKTSLEHCAKSNSHPACHAKAKSPRIFLHDIELPTVLRDMGLDTGFLSLKKRAEQKFLAPGKGQQKQEQKDPEAEKEAHGHKKLLSPPGKEERSYGGSDPRSPRGRVKEPQDENAIEKELSAATRPVIGKKIKRLHDEQKNHEVSAPRLNGS
jgi:hypothetical protein